MARIIVVGCRSLALTGAGLMAVVVLVTVVNVGGFVLNGIARPFGGSVSGLPGYEDAAALLVGVGALLMLPYAQLSRSHISVDLFTNALPPAALAVLERATDALMAVTAAFLAYMLANGAASVAVDDLRSPVLGWPVAPFMAPGVVALAAWSFTALAMAVAPRTLSRLSAEETTAPASHAENE